MNNKILNKLFLAISDVLFYLMLVAIICGALVFAADNNEDKSVFGYRYYDVLTPSMEPAYHKGGLIIVKLVHDSEIAVGDVITFNPGEDSDTYLTHRVVEKLENYEGTGVTCYRTQGDANQDQDPFLISSDRVVGKVVFGMPVAGALLHFIKVHIAFSIGMVILVMIFSSLVKKLVELDKEEKKQNNAVTEGAVQ